MRNTPFALVAALIAGTATAAFAGKADGVLRIAFADPIVGIDEVYDPKPETDFTGALVFNRLLSYDVATRSYSGELAESFKQIDPLTWEFRLRDGIVFHDGSEFDADDVVYTINFLASPDAKFRLHDRFAFLRSAEKIDPRTVRIVMREPTAAALASFARLIPMYPSDKHGALKDPATWGKSPVGTGPYKVISISPSSGIVLERNESYKVGPLPPVRKIEIKPIPDGQSQLAQMLVGQIDLAAAKSSDAVAAAAALPSLKTTSSDDLNFVYASLDAKGRSGFEPLKDRRVRQAIFVAIDRDGLRKAVIAAGTGAELLKRICFSKQVACPEGGSPPNFDPKAAKALLTEAGYPDGFTVEITCFDGVRKIAEAIAGNLRAIGVKASVDSRTMTAYRQKQADGKLQILVQDYSHGGLPDAGNALQFFFGDDARDYTGDARLRELVKAANAENDPAKRAVLVGEAYDRIDQNFYIMPISANPTVFIHSADVMLDTTDKAAMLNPYGIQGTMLRWSN